MDVSKPISSSISSISFSHLDSAQIRRISVLQVTNTTLFDNLNRANAGGLYDPVFGPLERGDICATCRLNSYDCPGHYGHIDLPAPVFHPLFMVQAYQLFRGTCTYCHHFLATEVAILKYAAKLKLLEHGLVVQADQIDSLAMRVAPKAAKGKKVEDLGESTDEPSESLEEYQHRLDTWVRVCLDRAGDAGLDEGRDEYKKSGIVYDKRKRVIAEFLKSLTKKKCDRCGAYAHRIRKEGHTKIVEYALSAKSAKYHRLAGIRRKNVLLLQSIGQRNDDATMDLDGPDVEEFAEDETAPQSNGKGKGRAVEESDDEEDDEEQLPEEAYIDEDEEAEAQEEAAKLVGGVKQKQRERIVSPDEVRAHLRCLFKNEPEVVSLLYSPHGPLATARLAASTPSTSRSFDPLLPTASADIFFMECVSVPPTRFRPAATMGDQVFENPQNSLLNAILRQTFAVRDLNEQLTTANAAVVDLAVAGIKPTFDKVRGFTMLLESLINLQIAVNSYVDSSKNPTVMRGGKLPPPGVKQMLEKKEGLFRMNMMGKRVNYAARSVISPDVNIETNEIGVPPVFARKLTFPEPVTEHNIAKLRQAVINGPNEHPGACFIQMEDGNLISLERMSTEERTAQANKLLAPDSRASSSRDRPDYGMPQTRAAQINRKVYRHLEDGDIVILNRQPTLHKPSMMCHRVKVLNGEKTIRMHYANCNSYNADFDGDEMNIHFPQSLVAQAEARLIANTDNQYLVPTSGNPLRGLIQDHVVSGVWLTNKDTFFTREEYFQLIYGALRTENNYTGAGMIRTLPPAVMKPKLLWTGKQIISTLMLNITPAGAGGLNLTCKGKIPGSAWGVHTSEDTVQFVDGELLTGILDKAQIGASPFGLVHSVFELYGPTVAGKLLSILSRVLTKFLQSRAFTCRMDDLLLTDKGNADRRAMLSQVNEKGLDAALDYVGLGQADKTLPETADDLRVRLEEVLRDDYKLAGLDATVEGETNQVTTGLIKTCLPHGLVKPFPHNNMQTMTVSGAKGSNVNASQISCLLGQQSLEGRRVPTMVSGKTLPSFKAFETAPRAGGFVAGRFLTGIRPQEYYFHCMAGREGLIDTAVKTSRSGYLQRCLIKHLEGLRVHYDGTVRNSDLSVLQFHYGEDSLDVTKQKHLMQIEFAVRNTQSIVQRCKPDVLLGKIEDVGRKHSKKALAEPDKFAPELSISSPATHLGSVSESYARAIEHYIDTNPQRLLKTKKKHRADWPKFVRTDELMTLEHFRSLMHIRYMRSLVDPGEAVGLLAAQGVGEPSTQMTLNTFHFAGHGAANVTLGIPRLREIVMTASQHIRTPTMQLPILATVTDDELKTFCLASSRLTLSQVVDEITVTESLSSKLETNFFSRQKLYTIRLQLYPKEDYASEYSVTPEEVLNGIERSFIPLLDKAIRKARRQIEKQIKEEAGQVGTPKTLSEKAAARRADADNEALEAEEAGVGRDDGEEEDGDADDARRTAQKDGAVTYESDEDMGEAELEAAFAEDSADEAEVEPLDPEEIAKSDRADTLSRIKAAERRASRASAFIQKVEFDKVDGAWCTLGLDFPAIDHKLLLVGIAEECCRDAILHEIPGISRCFISKPANKNAAAERMSMTEGVNIKEAWEFGYGVVDLDRIYTNEIGETLKVFGVEAARTSIMKEISGVFSVYGIGVDTRHLTILADYMTNEGSYKPFNRTGLSNSTSTFLKASFETTSVFIAEAALFGDFDDLGTPSARIVLGQAPRSGTGAFGILSAVEA